MNEMGYPDVRQLAVSTEGAKEQNGATPGWYWLTQQDSSVMQNLKRAGNGQKSLESPVGGGTLP